MSVYTVSGIHTLLQRGADDSSGAEFTTIAEIDHIQQNKLSAKIVRSTELGQQDKYQRYKSIFFNSGELSLRIKFTRIEYQQMLSDYQSGVHRSYRIVFPDSDETIFNFSAIVTKIPFRVMLRESIKCNITLNISGKHIVHPKIIEEEPPVLAGYIFVTDSRNNKLYKFDINGELQETFDNIVSNPSAYLVGIAVDSSGNMYTTDTTVYAHGGEYDTIRKHDSDGGFLDSWGYYGTGQGQCHSPWGIDIDPSGNIAVIDSGNNRVQVFTSVGDFVSAFGEYGEGEGQFDLPLDLHIDSSGNIFVANTDNHCIQKFNSSGELQWQSGSQGYEDGQFQYPSGIAIDSDGYIYVVDRYNYRVQKFDSSGNFLAKWGGYGTGNSQFDEPSGIAIDSDDNIYVVDTYNYRVQVFDSNGNYLSQFALEGTSKCFRIYIKSIS